MTTLLFTIAISACYRGTEEIYSAQGVATAARESVCAFLRDPVQRVPRRKASQPNSVAARPVTL